MEEKCPTNCTHYVNRTKMRLYKKSFLWVIVAATICTLAVFGLLEWRYSHSLKQIVCCHEKFVNETINNFPTVELSKDTCYYLNEQLVTCVNQNMIEIQTLLELQSNKINSDFTILSVWAGILMIVFLIFSIYSMFKTDELIKQSREGLIAVENAKEKVEKNVLAVEEKAQEEIKNVNKVASLELENIKEQVTRAKDDIQQKMEGQNVKLQHELITKQAEFQKLYDDYVSKLAIATDTFKSTVGIIKNLWKDQDEESTSESKG